MRDLAPDIVRQRLLIEGVYSRSVDETTVKAYLRDVALHLRLRTYGDPIVHAPEGAGKQGNQGFDAFIPLIDSGISLYVWSSAKFFAVVIFTCKKFEHTLAVQFTKEFFDAEEIEFARF